jgi:nucleotide-binding universal stress UspA family protein
MPEKRSPSHDTWRVLLTVSDDRFGFAIADFVAKHHWPRKTLFYILYVVDEASIQRTLAFSPNMVRQAVYEDEVYGTKLAERIAARVNETSPVSSELHIVRGSAQEMILETAKNINADLIIIGSRGRTALSSFLLGSVSMFVVAHARCSVLIVRNPDDKVT